MTKPRRKWTSALMPGDVFVGPADGLPYTVQTAEPIWLDRPNRSPVRLIEVVTGPGQSSRFDPHEIVEIAR